MNGGNQDREVRPTPEASQMQATQGRRRERLPKPSQWPRAEVARSGLRPYDYLGSLVMVALADLIALALRGFDIGAPSVGLVFLTAVLLNAITYGLWPALFASGVSALAYNFFFLPPIGSFTIADPANVVAVFIFCFVAFVASNLAARVRAQAVIAQERAAMTENLYLFSRKLAEVFTLDDLLWVAAFQFAQMLKLRVVILLPEGEMVAVRAGYPPEDSLDEADLAAAKWVWKHGTAAGRGADTLSGAKRLFLPMRTGRGVVGVVGLDGDRSDAMLTPDKQRLFDALADQAALAIERINLAEEIDQARLAAESERLRSALLTSISHDLRTPLASILGSASSLKSYREGMDRATETELIGTIEKEAERLNRFIANLLDMTRLESGALEPRLELVDISDVLGSALRRAGHVLAMRRVELTLPADLPMVKVDPVLLEQVFFNLLDNASKYTPASSQISVRAARAGAHVCLEFIDEGDGIPPRDIDRIFDKFYRVQVADRKRAGTGLGLAICRGFVEAMGGTIRAGNRTDRRGALFTVTLPEPRDQPQGPDKI